MYEIQKGVPIPVPDYPDAQGYCPYPFGKMEVGDSFSMEVTRNDGKLEALFHAMRQFTELTGTHMRTKAVEFTQGDDGLVIRVWRVA